MTMLVTLAEAKLHLRVDDTGSPGSIDDPDITLKIHSASGAVLNYIRSGAPAFLDSNGEPAVNSDGSFEVPYEIKAATLLLLGDLYKEREGVNTAGWEHGYLPVAVTSLLYPWRMPALA